MPASTDRRTSDRAEDVEPDVITPELLRAWPLPRAGESKYQRGQIVVVGGAARSPGGVMLAGLAALRVGAGRLTIALARSVAAPVAVAVMEAAVVPLYETADGHVDGASIGLAADDLREADTILVGPGLDDAEQAERLLTGLAGHVSAESTVVVDAYALGVLPNVPEVLHALRGRVVLTPNKSEAARLLGEPARDDITADDVRTIARKYGAVVSCFGTIADPKGAAWRVATGTGGLATSGSGDVLAGSVAGLLARGADASQAAVWATYAHAVSGDRLAVAVGPLGYLARELLDELPRVLVEIGGSSV